MRVLITGGAGFIGSHVVRRLVQQGHEVHCPTRKGTSRERLADLGDRIYWAEVELNEQAALRSLVSAVRPECAIHLAWYAKPGRYWTAPENLECVAMSLSLARALGDSQCRRLVAAGSCAEYDWSHGLLAEDSTPLRSRTLYGACKNATREILQAYCSGASMGFAWMRLFYLYGPGEAPERLVPSLTLALLNGQAAPCTAGEQLRDFLHVEDVASAVVAVAESEIQGPVNIGSGEAVKIRSVAETLARLVGGNGRLALGALPTDPEDPALLVADVRKLMAQTRWMPRVRLEEGLRGTVEWWRVRPNVIKS